jgi:selenide,water dikinase
VLGHVIDALPEQNDPRVLVGFAGADDAGVVRLDAERALVHTVDFFPPIVDDPYNYGAIAATNALSDIYAMGGEPLAALNILCWPDGALSEDVLAAILRGGADKLKEAGALLVGGHSVSDPELKYGVALTGLVHPELFWSNAGACDGDLLVLTKPLGTGIIATAAKRGECPPESIEAAEAMMLILNRAARDAAVERHVHACTDITGFGLLGHAWEVATASGVAIEIQAAAVPLLPGVVALAEAGHLPGGLHKNREYVEPALEWMEVDPALQSVLTDPQTSGGLLFSLPEPDAAHLEQEGVGTVVGRVVAGPPTLRVVG